MSESEQIEQIEQVLAAPERKPAPFEWYFAKLANRTIRGVLLNPANPSYVDISMDDGTVLTAHVYTIRAARKVALVSEKEQPNNI